MSAKKIGRPVSDNPKNTTVRVRMDSETIKILDRCVEIMDSNRSEVIRQGIYKLNDDLKNEKK